jgi:uncharacterized integral membrane protein
MTRAPTRMLFANTAVTATSGSRSKAKTRAVGQLAPKASYSIGVLDISAKAGLLFQVLEAMNRSQERFAFFPVQASVPMGVGLMGERVARMLPGLDRDLSASDLDQIDRNVFAPDYVPYLATAREAVGVDMLAGLVAPLLAFKEPDGGFHWNYFSWSPDDGDAISREVVVSTADVREFAAKAKRPVEAAIAVVTVAQVWAALFKVDFHDDTRGCLFDFCEDRTDLVGTFKAIRISDASLKQFPEVERPSVTKCVDAIQSYAR